MDVSLLSGLNLIQKPFLSESSMSYCKKKGTLKMSPGWNKTGDSNHSLSCPIAAYSSQGSIPVLKMKSCLRDRIGTTVPESASPVFVLVRTPVGSLEHLTIARVATLS